MRSAATSYDLFTEAGVDVKASLRYVGPEVILRELRAGNINSFEHASLAVDLYDLILQQDIAKYVYLDPAIEPWNVGHIVVSRSFWESLREDERDSLITSTEENVYRSLTLAEILSNKKKKALAFTDFFVYDKFSDSVIQYLRQSWDKLTSDPGITNGLVRCWRQQIKLHTVSLDTCPDVYK